MKKSSKCSNQWKCPSIRVTGSGLPKLVDTICSVGPELYETPVAINAAAGCYLHVNQNNQYFYLQGKTNKKGKLSQVIDNPEDLEDDDPDDGWFAGGLAHPSYEGVKFYASCFTGGVLDSTGTILTFPDLNKVAISPTIEITMGTK